MSDSNWQQVEIAGKTADVFEPSARAECRGAVLFLHGHGGIGLVDNPVYTEAFERHGLPVVCPHGQRSWWLDVVCDEFDPDVTPQRFLYEHVVPYMEHRWNIERPLIAAAGVSMGGQGALQLAYRYGREFPVVAAISPIVDFHLCYGNGFPLDAMFENAEEARQHSVTLNIHPLAWPRYQLLVCDPADPAWFEGVDRLVMKLSSSGIPVERDLETSGGGHTWAYFNTVGPAVVEFLAQRLDQVSRSVE